MLFLEFVVSGARDSPGTARFASLCATAGTGTLVAALLISRGDSSMKRHSGLVRRFRLLARGFGIAAVSLALAVPAFAQGNSPWENAVNVLQQAFTSTIARGLSLVAIVVSGLTFAFGEGGSKRVLAGVLFGVGMAIAAVNFLAWLFPA
jgi:type IV secretory pathway VirB2 component (pilin)